MLLHGLGAVWSAWRPALARLRSQHDVLALTLPGHAGGPALAAGPVTVATVTDQIEALLDRAGLDRAHLAGSSLGGWLALELARRGRALSVTAFAPVGLLTADEARRLTSRLRSEQSVARRLLPLARLLARTSTGRTLLFHGTLHRPAALPADEAVQLLDAYASCPGFAAFLDGLERDVPAPLPAHLPCPACVAWPAEDRITPLHPHAARFTDALPEATHVTVPEAGHLPMSDAPAQVADLILACAARAVEGARPL